jgi:hypothetical protein
MFRVRQGACSAIRWLKKASHYAWETASDVADLYCVGWAEIRSVESTDCACTAMGEVC